MNAQAQIKAEARRNLSKKANWSNIIAGVFTLFAGLGIGFIIYLVGILFISEESVFFAYGKVDYTKMTLSLACQFIAIVAFVMLSPLYLGFMRIMKNVAREKEANTKEMFYYFTSFSEYRYGLRYMIVLLSRYILWGIICMLPAVTAIISYYSLYNNLESELVLTHVAGGASVLCSIAGLLIYFVITRKYFLATYLFMQQSRQTPNACIKSSCRLMKGNKGRAIKLWFSFLPWFLLSYLVIPVFYVLPYYKTAACVSGKWLLFTQNVQEDKESENTKGTFNTFENGSEAYINQDAGAVNKFEQENGKTEENSTETYGENEKTMPRNSTANSLYNEEISLEKTENFESTVKADGEAIRRHKDEKNDEFGQGGI